MKMGKILMPLLAAAISSNLVLSGCAANKAALKDYDKTNGVQTAEAVQGGKINVNLGAEPPQMNPILSEDAVSGNVQRHVFEALTRLGKDGRPIPGIAEKWESADNGMKWTFVLRDARWSDGSPVTAEDFRYSFLTLLNKDTAAKNAYLAYCLKNGEAYNNGKAKAEDVGIKALSSTELEITLEKPTPYLPALLSFNIFMPVKKDFYEKQEGGNKYGSEADRMLFNGPYTIKQWKHEDSLILVKNPNYWNAEEIKLDEIKMMMIKDSNTALNTFKAGEIDMIGLTGDQAGLLKSQGLKPVTYDDGTSMYFEFNLKDRVMSNTNIRKALANAIDRKAFAAGVLKNNSKPAYGFTHPIILDDRGNSFAGTLGGPFVNDNDPLAKELFEKGLKELGLDKAPRIELITGDTDTARRYAQAFQEMWKKNLGFEVTITNMPFKAVLERMMNKDFSIIMTGWSADYNDPMSFLGMFETGNGNNHTAYSSAEYDRLLEAAQTEKDAARRMDTLRQMERLLMADMPIAPIYFRTSDYITKPELKGVVRQWNQDIDLYWAYLEKK